MNDFLALIKRLQREDVEFILIGGLAAAIHGSSLLTQDVDICCSFSLNNLLKLQKALTGIEAVFRMDPKRRPFDQDESELKSLKNIYLNTTLGQLDCLSTVTGLGPYEDLIHQTDKIHVNGDDCFVLSIPSLIKAKQSLNRAKDQEAVIQLQALLEKKQND